MPSLAAATIAAPGYREGRVDAAGTTDTGRRRSHNEDAFLIATLQRSINVQDASPGARGWFPGEPVGTLLIVADGMGGHAGGDIASSTAVNAVASHLLNVMPWVRVRNNAETTRSSRVSVSRELASAISAGDETVKAEGAQTGAPNMGTTLTMALVLWPFIYVAHVGDTRCYLLEADQLRCLTTDHNLAQKLAESPVHSSLPPERLQNILWNALGAGLERAIPDVYKLELRADAVLLLCSDGLNKHVADDAIQQVLASKQSCAERAQKLVELANAGGGTDNITALVADVHRQ